LRDEDEPQFARPRTLAARFDPSANDALDRGRLIHRLLQSLPDHPREKRAEVGARYLAAFAEKRDDRDELLAEVMAVMDEPSFAPVFAKGSRGEVEIAGKLTIGGRDVAVSGRVDRLAVTPERVLIADYKTNRPAPLRLEDVPRDYIAQLALYRRVLSRLYPGRPVAAAILWTDSPTLMEVPAESMDSVEVPIVAA
jgi:ATP-dependent helicase/nuclease subunit A